MTKTQIEFTNWLINKKYAFSTIKAYPYWLEARISKTFNIVEINSFSKIEDIDFLKSIESTYMSKELSKTEQDLRSALRKYIEFRTYQKQLNDNKILTKNEAELSFTEGGKKVIISTVIERNRKLRDEAIKIHKLNCQVCGFNFEEKYGEIGQEFIEVHHVVPLSEDYNPKKVDPKTDLNVVCSNCHKMIHRKKKITLSIIELKQKLKL
jgi:predicted HNH restriction endonuclease